MIKKIWIFILYKLYRSLLELSIPRGNDRELNIREIFETTIF